MQCSLDGLCVLTSQPNFLRKIYPQNGQYILNCHNYHAQISVRLYRRCEKDSSNFCKVQVKDNLTKHTRLLLWAPFMPLLGGIKLPCTCTFHLFAIVLKYIWQKVLLLSLACLCSRKSVCGSRDFSGGSHSGKMFLKMKVCAKNKS